MTLFTAAIFAGLVLGAIYALIALGLVLAFRATQTFNFAHGELMLLPAFIVGYEQLHHHSFVVSMIIALAVSATVGVLFYFLVLRRTTGLPVFMGIIATFGLAAILDGVMGILFQATQYNIRIPHVPTGSFVIAGAHISRSSVTVAIIAFAAAAIVAGVVRFTHLGMMIRAAGQNSLLASQCGIPVRWIYAGSWAVSSVLAALAGVLYGSGTVVNTTMINLGLAAIPAIVLGGMDSIEGAVVGGIGVGIMQGLVQTYLGGLYNDMITYCVLLAVLLIYPQGLLGTKQVVRA